MNSEVVNARKLNNRYRGVHQKYVKDIKKVEENKKAAKKKQTVKSMKKPEKNVDEKLIPIIKQTINEIMDDDGRFNWADLGNALKDNGIEPNMYRGSLSSLCRRLKLVKEE